MGRRRYKRKPQLFAQLGLFIGGPGRRLSTLHESYPAMTGADCPVFLCEAIGHCVFDDLSPVHLSPCVLQGGVFSLLPLLPRTTLLQPPLPGDGAPPAAPRSQPPPSEKSCRTPRSPRPATRLSPPPSIVRDGSIFPPPPWMWESDRAPGPKACRNRFRGERFLRSLRGTGRGTGSQPCGLSSLRPPRGLGPSFFEVRYDLRGTNCPHSPTLPC